MSIWGFTLVMESWFRRQWIERERKTYREMQLHLVGRRDERTDFNVLDYWVAL